MLYTILIYRDEPTWNAMSVEEHNNVHQACGAWHDDLVARGISQSCIALDAPQKTQTLRGKRSQVQRTDGPFAETKEVLGGLELIDCPNIEEAIKIASTFPGLDAGIILES